MYLKYYKYHLIIQYKSFTIEQCLWAVQCRYSVQYDLNSAVSTYALLQQVQHMSLTKHNKERTSC